MQLEISAVYVLFLTWTVDLKEKEEEGGSVTFDDIPSCQRVTSGISRLSK